MDFPVDIRSLLLALMINVLTTALVLQGVLGKGSHGALRARQGAALQAAGWIFILASTQAPGTWVDRLLSSLSLGALAASLACLREAFDWWCGHRTPRRLQWLLVLAVPTGYALGFGHYGFRVGWSNGLLALLMLTVAWSVLRRPAQAVGPWRWLVAGAMAAQAAATLWRGVLGAFFTSAYPTFLTPHPVNIASALAAHVATLLVLMAVLLAHRDEAARELERLATVDGLTGLLNRRAWLARATEAFAVSRRYHQPLAVLMIDLDHFKQINDTRGHRVGDHALALCARELMAVLRQGDLAGRYGGEEFCVLLLQADAAAVMAVDGRLRARLAHAAPAELGFGLDYSAGMALRGPDLVPLEVLLHDADQALYRAKAQGRGRTTGPLPAVVTGAAAP